MPWRYSGGHFAAAGEASIILTRASLQREAQRDRQAFLSLCEVLAVINVGEMLAADEIKARNRRRHQCRGENGRRKRWRGMLRRIMLEQASA